MVGEKIWMSMVARARKAALEAGYRTQNEKAIEALIAEAVTLRNELETALRNTDQEAEALKAVQANRRGILPRKENFTGEVRLIVAELEHLRTKHMELWDRLYEIAEPLINDQEE